MMKSLNARIFWCWSLYCIVGCGLLPDMVLGARYLPTRRSIPTQLERNERLRELFQHILESERDAHLSAANQFADQLKLIQKKSTNDFGMLPEPIKDYNDEFGEEYDYQQQQQQQQRQKQPWRFILLNYAHGAHRNHKLDQSNSNANPKALHNDDMVSSRSQQLMQKLYRGKQQKSSATNANADASDSSANSSSNNNNNNDLDWITSNSELNSATDYDALYDDVNEKRSSQSSSSSMKFDRYRRNGPMVPRKEHLN
ncbi:probable serine/threonine-protein kinase dyrk1 [Sitodiplosis mosellana]|uniref:probable serine/threonine-protein kinase dyrk1 n=1 Tax=Sitodiplosis mosellana TaxID=263140 RepID=UPI00244517FC|nr:probable serine/threonine-protein kinase dyrk1 [Sitodiplosis mosellana]